MITSEIEARFLVKGDVFERGSCFFTALRSARTVLDSAVVVAFNETTGREQEVVMPPRLRVAVHDQVAARILAERDRQARR